MSVPRKRRPGDPQLDLFAELEPDPGPPPSPSGIAPGAAFPANFAAGTCAFQHQHWRGKFYPAGLSPRRELAFYAQYANAVEIDGSFYRVPAKPTVQRWLAETPPGFRFALKAPKSLTHDAQLDLDNAAARADWLGLTELLPLFGDRLAAVLLQLGPWTAAKSERHLRRLLEGLGGAFPVAVEFRHASWNTAPVNSMLRALGATRAWTDAYLDPRRGVAEGDPLLIEETGPFIYLRLLGDVSTKYNVLTGALNHEYGSMLFDRRADLERWADRIRAALSRGVPVQCFINNHYEGFSPMTVETLRRALSGERP
ncbi:MAG: DUF72 domain-containing protein [Candidatus Sumerlaeia bacterium]|nr:DUF72 domain-containing protein [Candidatus Sumerlaeia bacterium]